MHRYTTPTIQITIDDVDFSNVDVFRIAIEKGQKSLLFVVPADDARVDAQHKTINIELTQEESASFNEGFVLVQARIKYTNGKIQATDMARLNVADVLDEVII